MALQAGTGGGDYLEKDEWIALGKEGALVACVVRGHGTQHMTSGPSAGQDIPKAEFDLYILDGKRRGQVHHDQSVIGRGLVTPLQRVAVGDEVAYRVAVGKNVGNEYPQLNAPGDLPQAAIDLFESLKEGGSAPAEKKEPATVGAKSGGSKASKSEPVDDLPDF